MITAIIVSYNSGVELTTCVASLLASSSPVKVVVSDNGSTDDSLDRMRAVIGDDERVSVIQNCSNLGFSAGCNSGLASATGEYVLFINPDCVVQPDTIARMRELMEANPNAGMAGCLVQNLDGSEQVGCRRYVPTPWRTFVRVLRLNSVFPGNPRFQAFDMTNEPLPDQTIEVEAISGAFMLVRRSALQKVGPLDDGYFLHCEDLDWCMRFRQAEYKILFVPGVAIMHLKGSSSSSRPVFVEWHKHKGMVRFYRRFFKHQYPRSLMIAVIVAVWVRFTLKSLWLLLRHNSKASLPNVRQGSRQSVEPAQKVGTTFASRNIIVTGATSQIGLCLLPRLVEAGYRVIAISRAYTPKQASKASAANIFWLRVDVRDSAGLAALPPAHTLIHLAPLVLLPAQLETFSTLGVSRLIVFSSSSVHSKVNSPVTSERAYAQRLVASEEQLAKICERLGIHWTIFRPTLIYGVGMDQSVTLIRRLINTTTFFPLLGQASGLRQPVHADDLAAACVVTLKDSRAFNKAYDLSGGETLSYREMVARIFASLGRKPRFVTIPMQLFGMAMKLISLMPKYKGFNAAMAQRMNDDLVFSHSEASNDFAYAPRRFEP